MSPTQRIRISLNQRGYPVTTMLCATLVQAALVLTGAEAKPIEASTYAEAHRVAEKSGKPIIVMVGTDWCSPCQMMKKTILPRVREHGLFRRVAFAVVNPDQDGKLADEITGGGPIPQLVMFRKTPKGWVRKKLVGGQSVETVEEFINEGLASDASDKKTDKKVEDDESMHHG
jgi:thioredoxin-like negative regulator of GroEL